MSKTKNLSKVLALIIMLALVIGILPMAASATTTGWVSVATGEMIAIDWTQSGTTYTGTVVDANTLSSTTYTMPQSFTLWTRGTPTFTYDDEKIDIEHLYDSGQDKAYKVDVTGIPSNTTSTLTVAITEGTYTVALPAATASASGGTYPSYVNGYLPVGQYATGTGWGSIYTNGTNVTGTTTKITGGYVSTGISLGACGGYVQFEFANPIQNSASNPYGVDFIVYGNAFPTNAEAGSVMVSNDGLNWFELAGSRYYRSDTLRNVNVSYKLDTINNVTGVYYKIWDNSGTNGTVHVYKNWTLLKSGSSGWWPEYDATTEKYGAVSGVDIKFKGNIKVSEVAWNNNDTEITYYGVTLVLDEDNASEYTFGYADVHTNGSSYGTASNPYAAGQNTSGGDGFDIAWAVNPDGSPAGLSQVKYVRVYTSAGIKYSSGTPYIYVHSAFNETSTEVCGLYVASGEGTGQTTDVQGASLSVTWANNGSISSPALASTITSANTYTIPADTQVTVSYASSGNSIFINGNSGTDSVSLQFSLEEGETQIVRVIAKDSTTGLPYIGFIKLIGA